MAHMKSAEFLDYWRDYFRAAVNGDIFETIKCAIMVAAFDRPIEFKNKRDEIIRNLFSCKLCDKCSNQLFHGEGNDSNTKGSSHGHNQMNIVEHNDNHQESIQAADALIDEIEEESDTVAEVLKIKDILENSRVEEESVVYNSLMKLQKMGLSVKTLEATGIGKSVNVLRKHASMDVAKIARMLIKTWKNIVDKWVNATEKMGVSSNPCVLYKKTDNNKNRVESPMEKNDAPKMKQQTSIVPKEKEGDSEQTKKHSVKIKLIRKKHTGVEQVSEKGNVLKIPVSLEQSKMKALDKATMNAKLEASKRKLKEGYEQAQNTKKRRRIQVMELHDLTTQGLLPQNKHVKDIGCWANARH